MMQSGQDLCGDDGPRSLESAVTAVLGARIMYLETVHCSASSEPASSASHATRTWRFNTCSRRRSRCCSPTRSTINKQRPHRSLKKDAPVHRAADEPRYRQATVNIKRTSPPILPNSSFRYTQPRSAALAPIRVVIACRHVLPVNRSMVRMTESVELAITCETMLRSAPNCAPNIGRMKRRPMRISIP